MKINKTVKSNAKINLGLHVLSKRRDGYHNIESVFFPVSIQDILKIKLNINNSGKNNIAVKTNIAQLSGSKTNLAYKAAELFFERFKLNGFDLHIRIDKRIPIGGGLGGGSSNAAAVLKFLYEAFHLKENQFSIIKKLALSIGSDVPFFLYCKPAYVYSRGEKLKLLTDFNVPNHILLVSPGIHVSTPWAYKALNVKETNPKTLNRINNFDLSRQKYFNNDFEKPVFKKYPAIKKIKEDMLKLGAEFSSMSGSGSTVYGFFNNVNIKKAVSYFTAKKYFVFVSKNPSGN